MYEPKQNIYDILSGIGDTVVYQQRPEILKEMPCITFYIAENTPTYELGKEIGYQRIEVVIDIYDNTSSGTGALLSSVVDTMLENNYRLVFSSDVPDPNGYSHITTRFNLIG